MIEQVRGMNDPTQPDRRLFFCHACKEIFVEDLPEQVRSVQVIEWPHGMECPVCGYLDGQGENPEDDIEDIAEAADRRFPRGTNDH